MTGLGSQTARNTRLKTPRSQTATGNPAQAPRGDREEFKALAQHRHSGFGLMLPKDLAGHDRRLHVRATLREDHRDRIVNNVSGASDKFEKLAGSAFAFFRGTALLFYRDMAGMDGQMPTVLALGDVHPKNFGIMPNKNNVPIFGVNDFDETFYAPFTWDLKRGATAFMLAAEEDGGHKHKKQRKIAKHFLKGYIKAMQRFAQHATERYSEMRYETAPKVICKLFDAAQKDRADWLRNDYLEDGGAGFKTSEKLTPISARIAEFQGHIHELVERNGIDLPERAGELKVKDVAIRHGQGTASLGLDRYYTLIEGPAKDATDDLIIEFKHARDSALDGLVPPNDFIAGGQGDRIAHGQKVHLAHGDIFYGWVEIDGKSFMTRERAPFRKDIDLNDLSYGGWKKYARACGMSLAKSHALSDDDGHIDYDVEPAIINSIHPDALFIDDILAFADETMKRLHKDHAVYQQDHALGAFERIDTAYR